MPNLMTQGLALVLLSTCSLLACAERCPIPDENTFSRYEMPIGYSFSYPDDWYVEQLHEAVWMRNYCMPSIWLSAGWYEVGDQEILKNEQSFLEHVVSGLSNSDPEGRFHPIKNTTSSMNIDATLCVRSIGKLEEHFTQSQDVILHSIDYGDLACIHPSESNTIIHLFYWVEADDGEGMSPQQALGEKFLGSFGIKHRDNNGLNADANKAGAKKN